MFQQAPDWKSLGYCTSVRSLTVFVILLINKRQNVESMMHHSQSRH